MAQVPPKEISGKDLPLFCPPSNAPLWSQHPRVFLDIVHTGEAVCPYCSAHYVLTGEAPGGH
ncbi:MAG: zinc-finger domain-containing protein [Betaproteobacteria bacterium]